MRAVAPRAREREGQMKEGRSQCSKVARWEAVAELSKAQGDRETEKRRKGEKGRQASACPRVPCDPHCMVRLCSASFPSKPAWQPGARRAEAPRCRHFWTEQPGKQTPDDHYFEIPSNVERRAAWLKRISRQGTAKGSPWQPASRSVVCSRHFIDKDYREGCKRKLLQSSAIPTVFPEYPSYLQGGDCPKRRKLSRQENDGTQSDRRSNQERANENDSQHADDRSDRVDEPPAETDPETEPSEETTRTDQECQTVLNVAAMIEENKRNTHRLQAIEDAGFHVTRIVTDNHKTNAALFRSMSEDKTLQHVIAHPLREDDSLFLSFDPNHLIKNLRTNLLERSMFDGDEEIQGGLFLKELYDIQSGLLVKPVRFLTWAHVDPNNLEKMKVSRATLLFSPVVIGTLEYLKENPSCHERAPIFEGCGATVRFMRAIGKWYALHNIGGWTDRHDQEQPFITTDDERLSWLEVDFVEYMEHLRTSGHGARNRCMTKETYEATMMTTRSTVALAEYLLDNINFRYVLTRCLNSDPVESLFSCFRQFNGGNDKVDARTAVFTAERLLKVGIVEAAKSGNAPTSYDAQTSVRSSAPQRPGDNLPPVIEMAARKLMRELRLPDVCDQVSESLELAPLAYVAGYIALACDEKVTCPSCKTLLHQPRTTDSPFNLLRILDRGGLTYPTLDALWVCKITCRRSDGTTEDPPGVVTKRIDSGFPPPPPSTNPD
ncbi:hypothetical protein HPB47_017916 [Ixodes persulcatus]|uniref:Uncharacterized protein n=1 Tax=Ixodes persulcatus TaxID=34615 RepID=A0AC60QN11_IXOPE|nr:hypothetical protein HPB47_017916 [Ixodes persulcatus]